MDVSKKDRFLWKAYCDGASRGNPGPASFGVLLIDPKGSVIKEFGILIGINTNQVAEYEGVIRSLKELEAIGAQEAEIFTDSQFVVKQVSGEYKARDSRMKELLEQVRGLEKKFKRVIVRHIPRSSHPYNKRVDQLANQVLDQEKNGF